MYRWWSAETLRRPDLFGDRGAGDADPNGKAGGAYRSFDQSMRQRVPLLIQTRGLRLAAGVPRARW